MQTGAERPRHWRLDLASSIHAMGQALISSVNQVRKKPWVAIPIGVLFVALLSAGAAFALHTKTVEESPNQAVLIVAAATDTPGPSPTATPTPLTPTPTTVPRSTPNGTGLVFDPPPPRGSAPPANAYGIARITAPRLNLDSYIETLHIANGEMETPTDGSYSVGFYPDYPKPGESGNAIFSAHETWNHMQGPFYFMHLAQPGDDIYVQMTDGSTYHYQVLTYNRYDINTIPMDEVLTPTKRPFAAQWLTLITCGGRIVYDSTGFGEYLDRDVVVAKRII
jgi:sortase (surface protein transpeptidase)